MICILIHLSPHTVCFYEGVVTYAFPISFSFPQNVFSQCYCELIPLFLDCGLQLHLGSFNCGVAKMFVNSKMFLSMELLKLSSNPICNESPVCWQPSTVSGDFSLCWLVTHKLLSTLYILTQHPTPTAFAEDTSTLIQDYCLL